MSPSAFVFLAPSFAALASKSSPLYGKKFEVVLAETVSWSLYRGVAQSDDVANDSAE
jgi:hypothetical protein